MPVKSLKALRRIAIAACAIPLSITAAFADSPRFGGFSNGGQTDLIEPYADVLTHGGLQGYLEFGFAIKDESTITTTGLGTPDEATSVVFNERHYRGGVQVRGEVGYRFDFGLYGIVGIESRDHFLEIPTAAASAATTPLAVDAFMSGTIGFYRKEFGFFGWFAGLTIFDHVGPSHNLSSDTYAFGGVEFGPDEVNFRMTYQTDAEDAAGFYPERWIFEATFPRGFHFYFTKYFSASVGAAPLSGYIICPPENSARCTPGQATYTTRFVDVVGFDYSFRIGEVDVISRIEQESRRLPTTSVVSSTEPRSFDYASITARIRF